MRPPFVCACGAVHPDEIFRTVPLEGSLARCEDCETYSKLIQAPMAMDLRTHAAALVPQIEAVPLGPDDAGWLPRHLMGGETTTITEERWLDGVHLSGLEVEQYLTTFREWLADPEARVWGTRFLDYLESRLTTDEDGRIQLLPASPKGEA